MVAHNTLKSDDQHEQADHWACQMKQVRWQRQTANLLVIAPRQAFRSQERRMAATPPLQ